MVFLGYLLFGFTWEEKGRRKGTRVDSPWLDQRRGALFHQQAQLRGKCLEKSWLFGGVTH